MFNGGHTLRRLRLVTAISLLGSTAVEAQLPPGHQVSETVALPDSLTEGRRNGLFRIHIERPTADSLARRALSTEVLQLHLTPASAAGASIKCERSELPVCGNTCRTKR